MIFLVMYLSSFIVYLIKCHSTVPPSCPLSVICMCQFLTYSYDPSRCTACMHTGLNRMQKKYIYTARKGRKHAYSGYENEYNVRQ
jgi:hypothetical protein